GAWAGIQTRGWKPPNYLTGASRHDSSKKLKMNTTLSCATVRSLSDAMAAATRSYVAWFQPVLGSYQTSGLAYGDCYSTLLDRGFLMCNDARTGAPIYGRQRIAPGANFSASPWAYNGRVFLLSEEGNTWVIVGRIRWPRR